MIGTIKIIQKGGWLSDAVNAIRAYVGRPSILGNPYSHLTRSLGAHKVSTREEAVYRHSEWLDRLPRTSPQWQEIEKLAGLVREGRNLALECWCGNDPPLGHCHAATIAAEVLRLALREGA